MKIQAIVAAICKVNPFETHPVCSVKLAEKEWKTAQRW
jgi:hypothetical protein